MVHRHAVTGRRVALTALGALVATGIPAAVAAEPTPAAGPPPSAAQTLGAGSRTRDRALKTVADVLALLLTAGFIAVPVGVMTKVVS